MVEFRMPSLGADMEAGTLVEWLVKPGDRVKRGDVVAVVDTQKGAIEIEIFENGHIEQILVEPDTKVPIGTPLARIRTETEAGAAEVTPPPAVEPVKVAPTPAAPPAAPIPSSAAGRARVSPAARRLAETHGVDLSKITGSGPDGAITYADVERQLGKAAAPVEKKHPPGLDLDAMRAAIAAAMSRSKREIPHYYLEHQVDVTACEQWLARTNAARPPDTRL
ncbi:MAG: biotin/lipoyl-containing protein, partial [Xanthobacteraceae bacterium]